MCKENWKFFTHDNKKSPTNSAGDLPKPRIKLIKNQTKTYNFSRMENLPPLFDLSGTNHVSNL